MAENAKSMVLPVVLAAVFAGLGRMVFQRIMADRAARENRISVPPDASARAKISDALRGTHS
ncbi:hypothetical protein KNN17_02550 [Arthrobacter bambusae]|jgi:hypothetical protein|uniref:hypothetical protein n=1 Tax=Arthrobacter TaxID=1663 RepID=UPI000990DDD0|nr:MULTISPECIES: hypothetical protein [Arthrobacter]MCI0140453.1 hypothetical protein [Arthrobacter bambusae]MDQ0209416.1 hypothetical protein [Arthrobacter bambusae]MDQ0234258.1 hypothetical protein [Arthrobacter bambusae]OOP62598.1 hypothetical protein BMF89_09030 [Arthrobacter sp. SRS-W-1-2016]UYY81823.1 hypothetical protein OIT41_01740 [Arthrobacter sp. YA7-1]